jgi:hypothetical protein
MDVAWSIVGIKGAVIKGFPMKAAVTTQRMKGWRWAGGRGMEYGVVEYVVQQVG